MPLRITGRHVKVTEDIRNYVDKKMPRINKYGIRDESVEFVIEKQSFRYRVEIRIKDGPIGLTANHEDADLKKSIDFLVDKVESTLKRKWEKIRGKTKRRADDAPKRRAAADALLGQVPQQRAKARRPGRNTTEDDGSSREMPEIVEKLNVRVFLRDDFDVPEMSVAQAAEELYFRDENFLCFHDTDQHRLSILYRRKDGNFALVRPGTARL